MSGSATDNPAPPKSFTFTNLVLSLSTAALQHLGAQPESSGSPAPEVNLPMAQQTIDILAMLQEKTNGNLSDEESKLLGNILYDLRIRFVNQSKGSNS